MAEPLDLDKIRRLLEEKRAALSRRMAAGPMQELAGGPSPRERTGNEVRDVGDESVADLNEDVRLADAQRVNDDLRLVEEALARLDQGTYGLCIVDEEPIEPRRLYTMPEATRCLRHQAEADRRVQGGPHHATM